MIDHVYPEEQLCSHVGRLLHSLHIGFALCDKALHYANIFAFCDACHKAGEGSEAPRPNTAEPHR